MLTRSTENFFGVICGLRILDEVCNLLHMKCDIS